ncbi:MAG: response regulator [Pirellulaceae bacterium]|nr:response regulator [Pirellulaceae bacterium]
MNEVSLRVLIVEDNPVDAKLLEYELRRGKFDLTATRVDTESEYLAALSAELDIVICDWQLPQFDCLRALNLLRERDPHLPFILVSGSIGEEAAVEAMKLGASDYFIKDRLGRLVSAVERAMAKRQSQTLADRATQELKLRESQLAEAQRVARMGSWVWMPAANHVWWSDAMFTLFGIDRETTVPSFETFLSLLHPDDRSAAIDRVQAMLGGADQFADDFRVIRSDGALLWIHSRARATRDADGNIIRVEGTDQDITERCIAEADLRKTSELLQAVLGSVSDAILTSDCCGKIHMANLATERMFGYSQADLIGTDINQLLTDLCRQDHELFVSTCVNTTTGADGSASREFIGQHKDGHTFPIEVNIAKFQLDGQRRVAEVIRDITERKRLEEQFHQAQKMEAIGRLAGGVAHDFNNLLTVINGYSDMLLEDVSPEHPSVINLRQIRQAGERAARLTAQLLAFSRKSVVAPKVLDLNVLIQDLSKMLRPLIGEDVTFTTVLAPGTACVEADPGQIEQVLMNLIVNSRDAMPRGGKLTIATSEMILDSNDPDPDRGAGRYSCLHVADTGCGMSLEVQKRLFEPFFTTKKVGQGTGLGLATVYGIVKQAGGTIAVKSEEGVGTEFTIALPSVVKEASNLETILPNQSSPRGTETILLVEDEVAVLDLVRSILESHGYTVLAANGQAAAMEIVQKHAVEIDLLITDVVMPLISGRDLAENLRSLRPNIRVLYMSGYTGDAVVRYGVELTAETLLQKPFTALALARKVRRTLDRP